MQQFLAAIFLILLSAPAFANPAIQILGKWICTDRGEDGVAVSDVKFTKSGKFIADMRIEFLAPDLDARAHVDYRARYKVVNKQLIERPYIARIKSFMANGVDISRSLSAEELQHDLLNDSGDYAEIKFPRSNELHLVVDDRTIFCKRPDQNDLNS